MSIQDFMPTSDAERKNARLPGPAQAARIRVTGTEGQVQKVGIILLAAGTSSRMRGRDKLMEPVAGQPLVAQIARACIASGARPVLIALNAAYPERRAALDGLAARLIDVPDAAEGMAASIRAGLGMLPPDAAGVMIVQADMPNLTSGHLAAMIAGFDGKSARIVRARAAGHPANPILFGRAHIEALARLSGDRGAREYLKGQAGTISYVDLPPEAIIDLDTPEDWAAWRQRR
jgi:molybdenum cofactor cytidylyltransferase